jgi:cation diffusion facilitator family transporter
MAGPAHATRTVAVALLSNLVAAVALAVGFVVSSSVSLLAAGIVCAAGIANQLLLVVANKRSRRTETRPHPFGYGRDRYFGSFVVAILMAGAGATGATGAGAYSIVHPPDLGTLRVALFILAGTIILKGITLAATVTKARTIKGSANWWRFLRRATRPDLPPVLTQELVAMVGLLAATAAVTTSMATDATIYDASAAVAIGAVLTTLTVVLAVEMKGLLIGGTAGDADEQGITAAIEIEPGVARVVHMHTQHLGPGELLVGAKVELVDGLDLAEVAEIVSHLETRVRRAVPAARIVYLEPDVFRTTLPRDLDPPPSRAPETPTGTESPARPSTHGEEPVAPDAELQQSDG